jgi:hypothetical protein
MKFTIILHIHFALYNLLQYNSCYGYMRKLKYPEKTTDLLQVRQILSHNVVLSTPRHEQSSNSQP